MNRRRLLLNPLVLTLSIALGRAARAADDDKGYLGLAVAVDGEGWFLNPTLNSVTITSVAPGSPAALQGIAVGDQVIELEGIVIKGRKARELQPLMKKAVGQAMLLRLKRPGGELYSVTLVAVHRPAA